MSDDGEPLTSDDDDNAEAFDAAFTPLSGAGAGDKDGETDAADGSDGSKEETSAAGAGSSGAVAAASSASSSSAASSAKKQRERKSGSESGDGKSVSSPRYVWTLLALEPDYRVRH